MPVVSQLPLYAELVGDGERGLLFPPGDALTLAGQLERLSPSPALRERSAAQAPGRRPHWATVADEVEAIYRRLARAATTRRQPGGPAPDRAPATIEVDLHMHTDHSPDCATPVEVLLETARDRGLGAIAITDHNEVSGRAGGARDRRARWATSR